MGFVVASLTDYINEQSTQLISRLYFEKKSADYFTVQTGVKSVDALHLLEVSAIPQDGSTCSVDASGSVTFTNRNLTVKPITYVDKLCVKDLNAKWTQIAVRAGANAETEVLPFEQQISNEIISRIQEIDEVQDWQGDTDSGDVFINKYDGLIKTIDAAGSAVAGNTSSATTITAGSSGNADTLVNDLINARPAKLKSKANQILFVGTDFFDKYVDTLAAKNLFHVNATLIENYEMKVPGKNVEMIGVHGLDGTNRLFLSRIENIYLGLDLADDDEEFRTWYEIKEDSVYYRVKYKRGLQVAYPSEIVEFTLAV